MSGPYQNTSPHQHGSRGNEQPDNKERLAKGAALVMLAVMYVLMARVSTNYAMIGRDPILASAAGLSPRMKVKIFS